MAAQGKTANIEDEGKSGATSLTRGALYNLIWSRPSTLIAGELGMSRNGLTKICDRLLVPYPGRGYWAKLQQGQAPEKPALPPGPENSEEVVLIAPGRAGSRRPRTRLPREARAEQLVEAAGRIIAKEGLHAASMKRVAREIGISEAQAHNYFGRWTDLLIALARREISAMNSVRESEVERGHDNLTRVTLSTITYLRQVAERGTLIQTLLNNPDVRVGLRADREAQTTFGRRRMTERLNSRYGVPRDIAYGATVILTSVVLRAGRLLAERKVSLQTAERLSLAITTAGNRSVVGAARASAAPTT
jgi:AcrR family transcriptional regulator